MTTGGHEKLAYFIYFSWLPVEAAVLMFNFSFFVKNDTLRRNS
jgi:hypothetical protein